MFTNRDEEKYRTVFDETILLIDTVMVSGGKQGTQVELTPEDILKVTDGLTAPLTR